MVSKVEPDRYADTGFSVKDTAPEVNAFLFRRMMALEPAERLRMGMDMTATARALVWASLPEHLSGEERRIAFYERFYGEPWPMSVETNLDRKKEF
jgi:hypothetical protein